MGVTWESHVCHMGVACVSHACHMGVACVSHAFHVNIIDLEPFEAYTYHELTLKPDP